MFRDMFRRTAFFSAGLSIAGLIAVLLNLFGVFPLVTGIVAGACFLGELALIGATMPLLKQYF